MASSRGRACLLGVALALLLSPAAGRLLTSGAPGGLPAPAPSPAAAAAAPAPSPAGLPSELDTTLPLSALAGEEPAEGNPSQMVETKIINGAVVQGGDFDFMAALFNQGRFFCGGALLDNTTVLTAAHCVVDTGIVSDPSVLTVWVMGTQYPVASIHPHPGYSAATIPNDNKDMTFEGPLHDLAVLKLAQPVPGAPATISLAPPGTRLTEYQTLQVSGWGTTEQGTASNQLKYGEVFYLPASRCPADYDDALCAGGTGENTCNGDSGGPLIIRDAATRAASLVGITSHGPDCQMGNSFNWGFYTDARLYEDAIAAWREGREYQWDGKTPAQPAAIPGNPPASSGSGASAGAGSGSGAGGWQPVPGWSDQWGSGWSSGSGGGSAWQSIFCTIFGC